MLSGLRELKVRQCLEGGLFAGESLFWCLDVSYPVSEHFWISYTSADRHILQVVPSLPTVRTKKAARQMWRVVTWPFWQSISEH